MIRLPCGLLEDLRQGVTYFFWTKTSVAEQTRGLRAAATLQACEKSWEPSTRRVKMAGNASRRQEASLR